MTGAVFSSWLQWIFVLWHRLKCSKPDTFKEYVHLLIFWGELQPLRNGKEMLLIPQSWKWSRKFSMVKASQRRHLSSPLFPEHSFLPGCWWNSLIAIHNASVSHWDGKTATLKCTEPLKNWSVLTKDCFIRDVGRIIRHVRKEGHTECDHQVSPLGNSLPLFGIVGFGVVFLDTCLQGLWQDTFPLGCCSSQCCRGCSRWPLHVLFSVRLSVWKNNFFNLKKPQTFILLKLCFYIGWTQWVLSSLPISLTFLESSASATAYGFLGWDRIQTLPLLHNRRYMVPLCLICFR